MNGGGKGNINMGIVGKGFMGHGWVEGVVELILIFIIVLSFRERI